MDEEKKALSELEQLISGHCPELTISGIATSEIQAAQLMVEIKPDLVFIDVSRPIQRWLKFFHRFSLVNFETIILTKKRSLAIDILKYGVSGCIQKPVGSEALIFAVQNAKKRIRLREEHLQDIQLIREALISISGDQLIGIPTMQGFDFLHVDDIIRCEGLQRCTRIVTMAHTNIVSSYHLGEFRKLLKPCAFFSPHRSHLVNLHHVKRYNREGTITMDDDSHVPVSRRKKSEFLEMVLHI